MNMGGMMGLGGGQMPDFSAMREKMFQKADGNGDNALSLKEFQDAGKNLPMGKGMSAEKAKEAFGKADANGDGALSRDEMRGFGERMSSQTLGAMVDLQALLNGGGGKPDPTALFTKADEDGNGSLSRSEFESGASTSPLAKMLSENQEKDVFAQIDGDGDGALSQDEMKAFGDTMKKKMSGLFGSTGGGQLPAEFQQAINAYSQGTQRQTELTSILFQALDGSGSDKRA